MTTAFAYKNVKLVNQFGASTYNHHDMMEILGPMLAIQRDIPERKVFMHCSFWHLDAE